jgi:hypothetical protein
MSDKKDDDAVSWNDLAAGDEERLGVSKDVLRKLMQMNPNLRGGKSTEDLMRQVKTTMKDSGKPGAPAGGAAQKTGTAKGDILDSVLAAKTEFEAASKRYEVEMKRLQEEKTATQQKLLLKLIDECLATDPGLTSPKSQYVLQQEKAFLDKLGFSMQKLVDRQKQLKK